jgi:hypothetical protein
MLAPNLADAPAVASIEDDIRNAVKLAVTDEPFMA